MEHTNSVLTLVHNTTALCVFQREEEAPGERQHAHPVQHERQEVHHRRGDQDQPITARVHQGSLRVRAICARELRRDREREREREREGRPFVGGDQLMSGP